MLQAFLFVGIFGLKAQTARDILEKYTQKTGGQEQWDKVVSMEITGTVKVLAQNMELPFLRIRMKDGRQYTALTINGMSYIATAFDGTTTWGSNAQMKLEEKDSCRNEKGSFGEKRISLTQHIIGAQKGFEIELLGKDTINETETYKIKLLKDPIIVDGKKTENASILHIDTKTYLLILTETLATTGANKGQTMKAYMSDYREIQGYWYPFYSELQYDGSDRPSILNGRGEIQFRLLKNKFLKCH